MVSHLAFSFFFIIIYIYHYEYQYLTLGTCVSTVNIGSSPATNVPPRRITDRIVITTIKSFLSRLGCSYFV